MTERSLALREMALVFHNEEKLKALLEQRGGEVIRFFDDILEESGQVWFSFSELWAGYEAMGYSLDSLVLDMFDSYYRQGEPDWLGEDTVLVGAIEMGGAIDLF